VKAESIQAKAHKTRHKMKTTGFKANQHYPATDGAKETFTTLAYFNCIELLCNYNENIIE
jgi:hypothetical protein